MKNRKVENIIAELKDQYLEQDRFNRPWIIGFSGGKDSTVLLTLVWIAMSELKKENIALSRQVYVVCNDTMVENPVKKRTTLYPISFQTETKIRTGMASFVLNSQV